MGQRRDGDACATGRPEPVVAAIRDGPMERAEAGEGMRGRSCGCVAGTAARLSAPYPEPSTEGPGERGAGRAGTPRPPAGVGSTEQAEPTGQVDRLADRERLTAAGRALGWRGWAEIEQESHGRRSVWRLPGRGGGSGGVNGDKKDKDPTLSTW